MSYSWSDIVTIAGDLPSLEVLQVHNNKIDVIDNIHNDKFSKLLHLDLDGNIVSCWESVNNLGEAEASIEWLIGDVEGEPRKKTRKS